MIKSIFLAIVALFAASAVYASGLFVVNNGPPGVATPSVTSYPLTATGNASPSTTISGGLTGFSTTGSGIDGICIDAAGTHLWVTDTTSNTLSRFNLTDNGNVAPAVTVVGASTTLNAPTACYFNAAGDMWVSNSGNNNMLRFSAANLVAGGNIAPSTTFTASDMSFPHSDFVDGSGNIYVGQFGSSACVSANCFAYLFPSSASGTTAPTAKWTNFASSSHVEGIGVGGSKLLLGLPSYPNCTAVGGQATGVYTYNNPTASSSAAPDVQLCGSTAFPNTNFGSTMAVDANGAVAVPIAINAGNIRIFYAGRSGNIAPDQNIVGASTGLLAPTGVAVVGTFALPTNIDGLWPFP